MYLREFVCFNVFIHRHAPAPRKQKEVASYFGTALHQPHRPLPVPFVPFVGLNQAQYQTCLPCAVSTGAGRSSSLHYRDK